MSVLLTATGPTVLRTYVFPDANATILTSANVVTPAQGGTGVTSYTVGDLLYASAAGVLSKLAGVATGQVLVSGGVATAPAWSATPTVTSLALTGDLIAQHDINIVNTRFIYWLTRTLFSSPADGQLNVSNNAASAGVGFDVATDTVFKVRTRAQSGYGTVDALEYRINGGAGAVGSVDTIQKSTAAIANAVATTILTITIPNAAHSATIRVTVVGSIGAGGAIGANEASAANSYWVTVTRTAGVNAVATVSAAFGAAAAAVAGATTVTATLAAAAVVGAVGASNTIPLQITITRGGGSSTNHTCQAIAEVLNANATGITVA